MSASKLQSVRGTQDLLPSFNQLFQWIESTARNQSELFGYGQIQTPIFEFSEVFHRTLGETSDVIHKETYTFQDRGGDSLTLRPEGTAGIARAFISEGLAQNLPLKFFYSGPMFRYERPQKGRYRQFHQIGVECLGQDHPMADVESINLGWEILRKLKISKDITLEINTLGDQESRLKYRDRLVEYLTPFQSELSPDSQTRLEKNPLRILDSKSERDKQICEGAPRFQDCLNDLSKKFFDNVLEGLQLLEIPFTRNEKLVRGLDYYCHTVFEFTTTQLGAQGTVLGGGRYDGLIETMGGPKTPAVGWAAGIERLCELAQAGFQPSPPSLAVIAPADSTGEKVAPLLAHLCRQSGLRSEILFSGNIGKKLKKADQMGARFALIIGSSEVEQKAVAVKDLQTGDQQTLPWSELTNLSSRMTK